MTSLAAPAGNPLVAPPSSDPLLIEVYLFNCGHGDTILVHLPNDRWGLIDCFLPEQDGVRKNFFKFIEDKNIKTFDFIFQTHPDYDHYHGMQAVIEYFLTKGEKIGYYIDTGLNARGVRDLLQNRPGGAKEYELLQDRLDELDKAGELELQCLAARSIPFYPRDFRGKIEFTPIGPDPRDKRRIMTSDLKKLATNSKVRPEANELSLVVVLSVNMDGNTLNVLLGADAGSANVERAIDYWKQYAQIAGLAPEFDAIKIPHHGSIKSHSRGLCRMKRQGVGLGLGLETASVCAGTRRALPDREVLREYLQSGWNVMATTTRGTLASPSLPMTLAHRGTPTNGDDLRHTIRLSWTPAAGLSAEPGAAKISLGDLAHYATASA